MATPADVLKMIKDKEVKFVDLRFTDTRGKEQHVTVAAKQFTNDKFESGHAFDGSSIAGWKGIQASDMLLMPDPATANLDPFMDETTLLITCDVIEPSDGKGYERDPRSLAKRAEAYLKSSGLGDTAYFGPEPEFFIFDAVEWSVDMSGSYCKIFSSEAPWSTAEKFEGGNMGIGRRSKAATFRCRRSIRCRTSDPRCVSRWSRWASRWRSIITRSPPRVRTKSAPSSRRSSSAPTGCRS
jgi:glutamine synthetase